MPRFSLLRITDMFHFQRFSSLEDFLKFYGDDFDRVGPSDALSNCVINVLVKMIDLKDPDVSL